MVGGLTVVGVGEMVIVDSPHILVGMALGSCVALMLYDGRARVAGLAHVMLPSATDASTQTPAKYADTAVVHMIDELLSKGGRKGLLVAKLAGGAQMFAMNGEGPTIGERNAQALAAALKQQHIAVVARDTGGTWARTVEFDTRTGLCVVKSAYAPEQHI